MLDEPNIVINPATNTAYLSAEDILSNIKALQPLLKSRGHEIESLRQIPSDIVDALREAGAYRMMMPRSWGGPEMNPMQVNEALEELAVGNAAVSWCTMIQIDTGLYCGWLDDQVAREMFANLDVATSGVLRPLGKAKKVSDGYVINGRWPFASGCQHAEWFMGGCFVYESDNEIQQKDDQGNPIFILIFANKKDIAIHDTWHTVGLKGTGSNDVEIKELFVPTCQTLILGRHRTDSPLYLWPAMFAAKMPGVALGIARAAIEEAVQIFKNRNDHSEQTKLAIADAQTLYASARAYLHHSLENAWANLCLDQLPSEKQRIEVVLARANAFQASRNAVQIIFDAIGVGAIYEQFATFERHLRDVNTASHHVMAQKKAQAAAADLMLGNDNVQFPFL